MAMPEIVNKIHVDGEEFFFEELPEETQEKVRRILNRRFLEAVGYREVPEKKS